QLPEAGQRGPSAGRFGRGGVPVRAGAAPLTNPRTGTGVRKRGRPPVSGSAAMSAEFALPARREPDTPASASTVRRWWRSPRLLLCLILVVSGGAIVLAMRRTSTTFDEVVMIAGGARGYQTGAWNIAPEHPPVTQYLYGLLPYLAGARQPDERRGGGAAGGRGEFRWRFRYAQLFLASSGS